jgi:hypothetical protein
MTTANLPMLRQRSGTRIATRNVSRSFNDTFENAGGGVAA